MGTVEEFLEQIFPVIGITSKTIKFIHRIVRFFHALFTGAQHGIHGDQVLANFCRKVWQNIALIGQAKGRGIEACQAGLLFRKS